MDLFVVPTISFRCSTDFVILHHGRRELLWIGTTAQPNAEWVARQLTEAFGWEEAPRYTIRDRDRAYGDIGGPATSINGNSGSSDRAAIAVAERIL